jgi:hypothetical protein
VANSLFDLVNLIIEDRIAESKESAPIGCGFELAPHRGAQVLPQLDVL